MASAAVEELPALRAQDLAIAEPDERWLVRPLWSHLAVGLVSGLPKLGKTWFCLDLAISVASGTDCLGRFPVEQPGPVLVYLAEDALPRVRERIAAICAHRGLPLDGLDLYVITSPCLRLDDAQDRARLCATVARFKPRLLLLDPLVRLHAQNENDAGAISVLLGFLRALSRQHDLAVAVVHHMSKKSRSHLGLALRGSSDLWAWADSSAYLTRQADRVLLTLEHRAAPAPEPILLQLALGKDGQTPHLEIAAPGDPSGPPLPPSLTDQILVLLRHTQAPLSRVALRRRLRINNLRLGQLLADLEHARMLERTPAGWKLAYVKPQPAPPDGSARPGEDGPLFGGLGR